MLTSIRYRCSPVFDPNSGFGGNGDPSANHCVTDGPFSTYTIPLGPGNVVNDQCLSRNFSDFALPFITSKAVRNATIQPTFEIFRVELEGRPHPAPIKPHSGGHVAVGGVLSDLYASPGGNVLQVIFVLRNTMS